MTERPWIAHSVIVYLPMSENWIWTQIAGHSRYRPLVLTKRAENLDAFPLDGVGGEIVAAYSGPVAPKTQLPHPLVVTRLAPAPETRISLSAAISGR